MPPNKKKAPTCIKYIYIIFIYTYFKSFYWSIECVKKSLLDPKIQKIKKGKNKKIKIVKIWLTELNYRRQIHELEIC